MKAKSNVWVFMLVAFGFSWLFWIPEALIAQGVWSAPDAVGSFFSGQYDLAPYGPLVASIVVTFFYQGGAGVKELLKRGVMFRLGKWWWVIVLTFPVLIGGALGLTILFGGSVPEFVALAQPIALPIALVWIFFFSGPLQEEFGWRGYAYENLRSNGNALKAAVLAGLMWGCWHIPLFFIPRQDIYYDRPFWGLLLTTILVGIILAWFYTNTRGSVFAAMVGHAMFNWSNYVFPALESDSAALVLFGFYGIAVAFIIWRYGSRTLARA